MSQRLPHPLKDVVDRPHAVFFGVERPTGPTTEMSRFILAEVKDHPPKVLVAVRSSDEFISELVPLTMRGKKMRRFMTVAGTISVSIVEYENVTISETSQVQRRTGVGITFTKEPCRDQPVQ
jgi:hypothetical protein